MRFANLEGQPEIFETIQGEGRNTGEPAVFARLSGCNLDCDWCDTPYTWDWENYDREGNTLRIEIGEAVELISGQTAERAVITGGEPLVQQTDLIELATQLQARGMKTEVETNGTRMPRPDLVDVIDQFNVSPKLSNSGIPYEKRIKHDALEAFARLDNADFKFVIDNAQDLDEVKALQDTHKIPSNRIFLMPQGVTEEQIMAGTQQLAEICKQEGYNLSTRLHVLIWGAKRGV